MSEDIARLVEVSIRDLHGIASRAGAAAVASEVVRLNGAVRDLARPMIRFTDQPADFPAALLRHADPANA
jgi:hypothetical protein